MTILKSLTSMGNVSATSMSKSAVVGNFGGASGQGANGVACGGCGGGGIGIGLDIDVDVNLNLNGLLGGVLGLVGGLLGGGCHRC
ncbi:hypothetical protein SAMD00019534_115780 [Acytostelium subglobosum LB1]|uniref:hypothetical protein n=2 Tax=Acytostelium subglobosum LB1 TaxID=1410327 RepID=UPI000644C04D|nr:hypothetical protein SAMD00019534_115780 [Acytostelium subglobosum LB1]GAM28402.1 hypothetical protein SAMD00019534_115780 [Acytostelium subglobosum LB1]|eukprot:XP_012748719.1 hypothetical protein SAMD00019534_115780 [Acytostelium subglobosum LB1]